MPAFANPVFCALDTTDRSRAIAIAREVRDNVGGLKIGMEAFYALGREGYAAIAAEGLPIFLDLKLHDIPNTVAGGIRALLPLRPAIVNIHASGGLAMMRAARDAAAAAGKARPRVIAVTVLTSLDDDDMASLGQTGSAREQAVRLARLAADAGLDGVVCSPHEIADIKAACGPDFLTIVPGIRPAVAVKPGEQAKSGDDQKRVMSPADARAAGADVLVVGRPITQAPEPANAAAEIVRSFAA